MLKPQLVWRLRDLLLSGLDGGVVGRLGQVLFPGVNNPVPADAAACGEGARLSQNARAERHSPRVGPAFDDGTVKRLEVELLGDGLGLLVWWLVSWHQYRTACQRVATHLLPGRVIAVLLPSHAYRWTQLGAGALDIALKLIFRLNFHQNRALLVLSDHFLLDFYRLAFVFVVLFFDFCFLLFGFVVSELHTAFYDGLANFVMQVWREIFAFTFEGWD